MTYIIKITPEMKQQFRSETEEHLNDFENMLLEIEKDHHNSEAVNSAFRHVHSIKGNSDYLGIKDINTLAHELEDLMDDIRGGKLPVVKEIITILFEGLDLLRDMNKRVADDDYQESDISFFLNKIIYLKEQISGLEKSDDEETETSDNSDIFSNIIGKEIKVSLEKLDDFMIHVSEFAVTKNRLNYLIKSFINQGLSGERIGDLKQISANISRISDNLQADIIKLRLVRISTLFERLPRIVRDISSKNKKKIELSLLGGETEIDRKIAEYLIDPLVHLIRNAADHGIESPKERSRKGKPPAGSVIVSAYHEGNYGIIEVTDDGKGFALNQIQQAAVDKRIFSADKIRSMSEQEILNLLFLPGFTTLSKATKISGRGVGLDIVQNNIQKIGGSVFLSGKEGSGAKVKMRIPLSMSLTDVLLTKVAGKQYAFPFSSVLKTVKVKKRNIYGPEKKEFIRFNDTLLVIKSLGKILDIETKGKIGKKDSDEEIPVVAVKSGERIYGIAVDDILRRENILIKPLEKYFAGIKEFSGTSILGDGSIVLVIDPIGIWN